MKFRFVSDYFGEKMITFIIGGNRCINFSTDLKHKYTQRIDGKDVNCGHCISYNPSYCKLES